jgi:hypothetical protein
VPSPVRQEIARDLGTTVPLIGPGQHPPAGDDGRGSASSPAPLADHYGHRRVILLCLGAARPRAPRSWASPRPTRPCSPARWSPGRARRSWAVTFAVAAARYAGDGRREALGRIQAVQTAGSILGAPLLTAVAAATLWRGAYVVVLAAYLLAGTLIALGLAREPRPAGRFTARTVLAAYRPLLGDRGMLALYGASALRALGWMGPFVYLGAFYAERHGLALGRIGLAYMIASGGMFAGNLAAGRWLGRADLRRTFAATTALLALCWAAVFTLPLATPQVVAVATAASFASGVRLDRADDAAGGGDTGGGGDDDDPQRLGLRPRLRAGECGGRPADRPRRLRAPRRRAPGGHPGRRAARLATAPAPPGAPGTRRARRDAGRT